MFDYTHLLKYFGCGVPQNEIVIYGLGNDEDKLLNTKHNIGRLFVETMTKVAETTIQNSKNYYWAKDHGVHYVIPKGYMNTAGKNLRRYLDYFKLSGKNCLLIIVQDDSDQKEGSAKLTKGGSSGGHKGIKSILEHTGGVFDSSDIWRIKLGIRPSNNTLRSETFVLKSMTKKDQELYMNKASKLSDDKQIQNLKNHNIEIIQNWMNQIL